VGQDNPARRERAAGLQEHEHKVLLLGRRQRSGGPQKRDHDPFMEHHPQRWKSTKDHVSRKTHVCLPRQLHNIPGHVAE